MLQNGVDIKTVRGMPGHYDAGFTLRTYTHTTNRQQAEAADMMGSLVAQSLKRNKSGRLTRVTDQPAVTSSKAQILKTVCTGLPLFYSAMAAYSGKLRYGSKVFFSSSSRNSSSIGCACGGSVG